MLVKLDHETPRFGVDKKTYKTTTPRVCFFPKLSLLVFRAYGAYQSPGFFTGDWIPRALRMNAWAYIFRGKYLC